MFPYRQKQILELLHRRLVLPQPLSPASLMPHKKAPIELPAQPAPFDGRLRFQHDSNSPGRIEIHH